MIDRDTAILQFKDNKQEGWITLIEIIFDNLPSGIILTEVFQKWGRLEIRFEGENEAFKDLVENIGFISQKICEICGKSGSYSIIDNYETTLCQLHFNASKGKEKYRK